jgi:hypothetical protein
VTKKIKCKIIDSTPLSTDENLHLGWDFSSSIYSSVGKVSETPKPAVTDVIDLDLTGGSLDCYA